MDPLRRKDDSGGDHRASQRTPPDLINAGNILVTLCRKGFLFSKR